jgi:hypothetical protein
MIRDDLAEAHERAWAAIARAGTWPTGEQRVAVAAEIRHAMQCDFCARLKNSLSPEQQAGINDFYRVRHG